MNFAEKIDQTATTHNWSQLPQSTFTTVRAHNGQMITLFTPRTQFIYTGSELKLKDQKLFLKFNLL